jgi:putative endonuclease
VYILGCADGSYYIGMTGDLQRRLTQHASGMGARMTRLKRPVCLLTAALAHGREEALRLEGMIKGLPLVHKEDLLRNPSMLDLGELLPFLQRKPTSLRVARGMWRDGESGGRHRCLHLSIEPFTSNAVESRAAEAQVEATAPPDEHDGRATPDYLITAHAALHSAGLLSAGRAAALGRYRVRTRAGQDSGTQRIALPGPHSSIEADYLTLCAALDDVLGRIRGHGARPETFTICVQSGNQLVVRQLSGEYQVRAANLQQLYGQTLERLACFKRALPEWQRVAEILAQLRT